VLNIDHIDDFDAASETSWSSTIQWIEPLLSTSHRAEAVIVNERCNQYDNEANAPEATLIEATTFINGCAGCCSVGRGFRNATPETERRKLL
jgi:hypothetical protein